MSKNSKSQLRLSIEDPNEDGGIATEAAKPKLKPPALYQVLMLNDDYTPMEFVVDVLQSYFGKTAEQATQIMLIVHTKGAAVCGVYTKDVAETKASMVNDYARDSQHPLLCEVIPADDGE